MKQIFIRLTFKTNNKVVHERKIEEKSVTDLYILNLHKQRNGKIAAL